MFPLPAQQKWPAQRRLWLRLRNMRMEINLAVPRKQSNLCRGHKCLKDDRLKLCHKPQVVGQEMFLTKLAAADFSLVIVVPPRISHEVLY
jgi:hypothetical protein